MSGTFELAELHPTQITLGFREVARRQAKFTALAPAARRDYIDNRVVPCIAGPRYVYLIDRHHMCRALAGAGVTRIRHEIVCDASALGEEEFWRFMDLRRWTHPFDPTGKRCDVSALPRRIAEMVDDPYRALAGFVRREQGFIKEDLPFEEFIWADFLRHRIAKCDLDADFDAGCREAVALARSQAARHLPGWRGQ